MGKIRGTLGISRMIGLLDDARLDWSFHRDRRSFCAFYRLDRLMTRSDESRDLRWRFPKTTSVGTPIPHNSRLSSAPSEARIQEKSARAGTMFGRNGPVTGAEEVRSFCWLTGSFTQFPVRPSPASSRMQREVQFDTRMRRKRCRP